MTDDGTGRDLRSQVAELSRIAAALGAWEDSRRQDNRDYRDDVARFHSEFRRVHDELGAISSAVTNAAIHMEGISQRLTNAVDDIADLKRAKDDHDRRILSLEAGRSRERGAWAVVVFLGTAIGATIGMVVAVIIPNFVPHWLKGP